jgi:pantoate--beta-alanine ligase
MRIIKTIKEMKLWRKNNPETGFVPTMGALHEGHVSLIQASVAQNSKTVVSIFVNPAQFAPGEDLDSYPRTFEADCSVCEQAGVDIVFAPAPEEMYRSGSATYVEVSGITENLCGKSRPTHFRGVCTVVCKLFNIVAPVRAYFGQKDAQQLAVIRVMVRDLDMDTEIIACPIVRESDGLAMSSRNAYLSSEERAAAVIISAAVFEGERLFDSGERDSRKITSLMRSIIEIEPLAKVDYVETADYGGEILFAAAVYIGNTRLIDNFMREI